MSKSKIEKRRINVTESFVPPMSEYAAYAQKAFDSKWLTNRGELTLELEKRLKNHLGTEDVLLMNNGTIPLQIAIKTLVGSGEIITTPFSYIASTSAIIWENCKPIFVDIESQFLTINPDHIEASITEHTKAILATHVFGNPCDIDAIERIAKKHNLFVIYDAAHCFNVKYKGQSIFNYGDVSTCSFHATKIFHTGEGGAIFTNKTEFQNQIYYSHNFGHDGTENFHGLGINGKISELQSAMGLAVLDNFKEILNDRKNVVDRYLLNLKSSNLTFLQIREETEWNYSYFPVIFKTEDDLKRVLSKLAEENIHPRRYFYPSLNSIPFINGSSMPVAESVSNRILCLPLFKDLTEKEVDFISEIIVNNL